MSGRLAGKCAVVTGGARGIGLAICRRLAEAGAQVVAGDLRRPEDGNLAWKALDVTDEDSIAGFVEAVTADEGGIDILVNNAGIMFEKSLAEQCTDDWDRMMAVNLKGPFLMAKHVVEQMAARGGGAIVNIGSLEGIACNPGHTAYAASKAGVHGLTVALAVDLGALGIRCNAVAPGWIDTDLNRAYVESHPDRDLVMAELGRLHPVGHVGDPLDVADVVVWLASEDSRFVTGQVITIDGGRHARLSLPSIMNRS